MDSGDLKQLKQLMKLCKEQRIKSLKCEGVELEFFESQPEYASRPKRRLDSELDLPNIPGMEVQDVQIPAPQIETDELSPEELLFYSAGQPADQIGE